MDLHRIAVLRDSDILADPDGLHRTWDGSRTVAVIPDKLGATMTTFAALLDAVPRELETEHCILLTSGSTGQPKLVVGNKRRASDLALLLHAAQDGDDVEVSVGSLPLSYAYALVNQWLWAKVTGRKFHYSPGLADPMAFRAAVEAAPAAKLCLVGAQARLMLRHFGAQAFPSVCRLHFAGSRFPSEDLAALRLMFPSARIFNNYGCTEAMPRLSVRVIEGDENAADVGRPLPGIELRATEAQALEFRSPYCAVGYVEAGVWHAIAEGAWVSTGDLGRENADGTWTLVGRESESFKRYGVKVSLAALGEAIRRHWSGQVAFYRELDASGENGHVLVLAPIPTENDAGRMLSELRERFQRAHWPLRVEALAELPKLPSGKIDIGALGMTPSKSILWRQRV